MESIFSFILISLLPLNLTLYPYYLPLPANDIKYEYNFLNAFSALSEPSFLHSLNNLLEFKAYSNLSFSRSGLFLRVSKILTRELSKSLYILILESMFIRTLPDPPKTSIKAVLFEFLYIYSTCLIKWNLPPA